MSKQKIIALFVTGVMLTACENECPGDAAQDRSIRLGAGVSRMEEQVKSRAGEDRPINAEVVNDFPFTAAVWFSTTSGKYDETPTDTKCHLPAHTTIAFKGLQLEYATYNNQNLQYPTGDDPATVYCVGLYPADRTDGMIKWETDTEFTTATRAINGTEDLMFATEISGTWNEPFKVSADNKYLSFKHQLTWVKVQVCATDIDAIDHWGRLESLSIKTQSGITINLADGKSTFSGEYIDINCNVEEQELHTTLSEVASVLCSPEMIYNLTVKTELGGEQNVPIRLINNDTGKEIENISDVQGMNVVITLHFGKNDNVIEGMCTLDSWKDQAEDIYLQ